LIIAFVLAIFARRGGQAVISANSIALLAEAAHMLADCASLLLAIIAIRVSEGTAQLRRNYGHRRYQPLAAFVNGQVLLLLTIWVVYEALLRLVHLPAVQGRLMLGVALLGAVANLAAFVALSGARSLNERSARAHVVSDLLGSGAASVAALLIIYRGWTIADPLLSVGLDFITRSAWRLIRDPDAFTCRRTLMWRASGRPLSAASRPDQLHHVHCWSMTGNSPSRCTRI
jgi:cobalt-zinc-cadmium efflux system protein